MRVLSAFVLALGVSGCAIGASSRTMEEYRHISASQIQGDYEARQIQVSNPYYLLFTGYWYAETPDGRRYKCSRDDIEDKCQPTSPARAGGNR